jgi:hypothetical protein
LIISLSKRVFNISLDILRFLWYLFITADIKERFGRMSGGVHAAIKALVNVCFENLSLILANHLYSWGLTCGRFSFLLTIPLSCDIQLSEVPRALSDVVLGDKLLSSKSWYFFVDNTVFL